MDSRKLEHLESFAEFIDFLSRPDDYKKLVADMRLGVKEWKDTNEKARGIKDVDKWRGQEFCE